VKPVLLEPFAFVPPPSVFGACAVIQTPGPTKCLKKPVVVNNVSLTCPGGEAFGLLRLLSSCWNPPLAPPWRMGWVRARSDFAGCVFCPMMLI
jgi:hypothetical protein